jgi:hypothetical protein
MKANSFGYAKLFAPFCFSLGHRPLPLQEGHAVKVPLWTSAGENPFKDPLFAFAGHVGLPLPDAKGRIGA